MGLFGEIQVTRYIDTRYKDTKIQDTKIQDTKKRYGIIRSISCILYLGILYLFDKPKFEAKKRSEAQKPPAVFNYVNPPITALWNNRRRRKNSTLSRPRCTALVRSTAQTPVSASTYREVPVKPVCP